MKPAKNIYDKSLKEFTNYTEAAKSRFAVTNNVTSEFKY